MLVWLLGCAFRVSTPIVGESTPLPLVAPEADPARPYTLVDDHLWFVDTGASRTTCDDDFVAALGLEPRPTLLRAHGEVGSVPIGRVVLRDVTVGGWTFRRLPCAVRDLATTSSVPDDPADPVAGILGANLFRRFVVDLDFQGRALHLRREPLVLSEVARVRSERLVGHRPVATLRVDGAAVPVVVDTGADRTYLPLESGAELARYAAPRQGTGPGGEALVDVVIRAVTDARLDGRPLPLDRYVHRSGRPGLLGMDALAVRRLALDARRGRLSWDPGAPPRFLTPDDARRARLEADTTPAGLAALAAWELARGDPDRAVALYARLHDPTGRVRALLLAGRWAEGREAAVALGGAWARLVDAVEGGGPFPAEAPALFGATGSAGVGPALWGSGAAPPSPDPLACSRLPAPRDADEVLLLVACRQLDRATDALAGLLPGAVRPPGMSRARARAAWLDATAFLAEARGDAPAALEALELAVRLAPWDPYLHARRAAARAALPGDR